MVKYLEYRIIDVSYIWFNGYKYGLLWCEVFQCINAKLRQPSSKVLSFCSWYFLKERHMRRKVINGEVMYCMQCRQYAKCMINTSFFIPTDQTCTQSLGTLKSWNRLKWPQWCETLRSPMMKWSTWIPQLSQRRYNKPLVGDWNQNRP